MFKSVKVDPKASVIWEHLCQVIVDFPVFTVNPLLTWGMRRCVHLPFSDASHFSCHRWRLSCLMILFSSSCSPWMLLRCSYSCFLYTASISMGIRPAMIHTASSDTIRKALDTLRALSRLTATILRRFFQSWGLCPRWLFHMWVSKSPLKLKVSFKVDEVDLCLAWASLMHWLLELLWLQRILHEFSLAEHPLFSELKNIHFCESYGSFLER